MSEFVEVKTQDLLGAALDWATAKATGAAQLKVTESGTVCCIYAMACGSGCWTAYYEPSTDWAYGGPLIEKYAVEFEWITDATIRAEVPACASSGYGNKHLTAACRAIVASILGDAVSVPKELLS